MTRQRQRKIEICGVFCLVGILSIFLGVQTCEYRELERKHGLARQEISDLRHDVRTLEREANKRRYLRSQGEDLKTHAHFPEQGSGNTLAERNRNYLNIKNIPGGWLGQTGVDAHGHAIFASEEYGIRAAASVLMNYAVKYGICTIDGLVDRFCEGNREAYKQFLSRNLGLGVEERFHLLEYLPELLRAMARFESGKDLDPEYFVSYDLLYAAFARGLEAEQRGLRADLR